MRCWQHGSSIAAGCMSTPPAHILLPPAAAAAPFAAGTPQRETAPCLTASLVILTGEQLEGRRHLVPAGGRAGRQAHTGQAAPPSGDPGHKLPPSHMRCAALLQVARGWQQRVRAATAAATQH